MLVVRPIGVRAALKIAVLVLALGACATSGSMRLASAPKTGAPRAASRTTPSTTDPAAADPATIARSILARVILPPGSRFVDGAPSSVLAREPLTLDGVRPQATEFAVSDDSVDSMYAFLDSHRPEGAVGQGFMTGTAAVNIHVMGETIGNLGPSVYTGQLLLSVVSGPGSNGSEVRIDATIVPVPRKPPGTTVPDNDAVAIVSLTGPPPGSEGQMSLPARKRVVVTSPAVVAQLRAAADGLQVAAVVPIACPDDIGIRDIVAFSTSSSVGANITYTAGECGGLLVEVSSATSPAHTLLSNDAAFTKAFQQVLGES